jgi:hypothetical protein
MKRKYYKVVLDMGDDLLSCWVDGKAQVEYKINKWVSAPNWLTDKGYHLCVFKSLKVAKIYLLVVIPRCCIFECEVKGIKTKLPIMLGVDNLMNGEFYPICNKWPQGTVMAKQVKLIREVK